MYPHARGGVVVLDAADGALGQNTVLPLLLVGVLDPLQVHGVVDLLNQLQSHHGVVGRLFDRNALAALLGRQLEELVDTLGVEDLVNTMGVDYVSLLPVERD